MKATYKKKSTVSPTVKIKNMNWEKEKNVIISVSQSWNHKLLSWEKVAEATDFVNCERRALLWWKGNGCSREDSIRSVETGPATLWVYLELLESALGLTALHALMYRWSLADWFWKPKVEHELLINVRTSEPSPNTQMINIKSSLISPKIALVRSSNITRAVILAHDKKHSHFSIWFGVCGESGDCIICTRSHFSFFLCINSVLKIAYSFFIFFLYESNCWGQTACF